MCWQESKTCHHDSRVKIRVKGANTSATAKVHRGSPVHFWLAIVYKTAMASAGLAVYAAVLAIPMKKSYGFSKSGTTFWKVVPLSSGNGYLPAVWAVFVKKSYDFLVGTALLRVRTGVSRVSTLKNRFHFHNPLFTGPLSPFPCFWRFTNVSHLVCESDVKRLRPFAPAGNTREPLFTGTFSISCESERIFFICNFWLISILLCTFAIWMRIKSSL